MEDKKLKHLELIQGVISRMARNLFYLSGWVITLVAGVLVLLTQIASGRLPIIFLSFVILLFWCYDGYFLALERMYRDLYDRVRKMNEGDIDFLMDVTDFQKYKKNSMVFCIFSPTLRYFYGPLLVATLYVIFFPEVIWQTGSSHERCS
jgi:hypothetical protein